MTRRQGRATEEWKDVNRNKRSVQEESKRRVEDDTKFFVSNLPEGASSVDLKEALKEFGTIAGVYIARKLDKVGNRFGFVSFQNEGNMHVLVHMMKNVKVGQNKLFISLARFVDGKVIRFTEEKKNPVGVDKKKEKVQEVETTYVRNTEEVQKRDENGNAWFKDNPLHNLENLQRRDVSENVWFRDKMMSNQAAKIPVTIRLDDNVQAFCHWHNVALVGRVREFSSLTTLKMLLKGEGLDTGKIKYLGGMNVLLVFKDDNQRDVFMNRKAAWSKWFESMDHWKGQSFSYERIASLKIPGVPLQLNMDPVFNVIGKKYGKVVQPTQVMDKDGDFSFALIGVVGVD
ncbi:putative RNA recognition motif domain, nucleotide-binding alpha-beta plait domain superfamily [Helianthus annuus]|uniref:RNA recognition motif domain, nucleotide-binding alpha-beta plait domain superfamily n=1 Tax=Helianthus annuus TaxID=4232 RepID=A0A9K3HK52_HELAN|nr:putative RNA recognition motif domain, nucleotide-binding alpha-beta plait domain superfamily [Helianthus annuus]KAJ0491137.1 putative RNA recognition motif domain, nucleotide-binding alpha-beta plait domain superfamily [Helianthus annuus]KAJ0495556.1 putative RNA recognition motif domain, nucleotide-binding alpha-beta plait domain superfamily [Helianthus annuus]KAJ0507057.1 putative RNA recognition motif domain, nucleotide-binding alpha-beta plait domain superfamily [Helianthus annuus]KAJ06